VAEGLSKVGQVAEKGMNFLAKKDQQAQELLSKEAGNMYTDKLDEWQVARKAALDSQNVEAIEASDKALVDLNPANTDWNNYLNPTAGGKLKDKSLGVLSAGYQTAWDKLNNRSQVDQNQAIIFNQTTTDLDQVNNSVVDLMLESPNGLDATQFQAFGEKNAYANIKAYHDGLTSPESKAKYLDARRAPLLMGAKHQLSTAASPEELQSRYDQISEFIRGNPDYNFNPKEIEGLTDAFDKQLKVVSDPAVQDKLAEGYAKDFFDLVIGVGANGDGHSSAVKGLQASSNVDKSRLTLENQKKFDSKRNLLFAYIQGDDGEPSIVQSIATQLIKSTEENRLSDETILELLGENSELEFQSSERKNLSAGIKNAVNEVEAKLALGDSTAWDRLFPEYKKLLGSEKFAEAKHYYDSTIREQVTGTGMDAGLAGIGVGNNIVWQEFSILTPTIDMDAAPEEITNSLVNSVTKNISIGALSTVAEASMRNFNSAGSSNDGLTALSTAMVAERVSGGEDLQAAASDVVNLLTSYDNLTEDQKADVDLRYTATMVNLDDPEASSQNILELPQLIEFAIEGATGSQVAESLQLLLRGVLTSSKGGKSSEQQLLIAKQIEAKNIIPVFGVTRRTSDGSAVQVSAPVWNMFVDPNEESSRFGVLSKLESAFDLAMGNQPQIKAKTVVKGIQNSVLISLARSGDFNKAALSKAFANFSIAPFENVIDSAADKAARGEDITTKPLYTGIHPVRSFSDGADNSGIPIDISHEEYAIAFARGLGTNEYNPDKGFLNSGLWSGDGQAISRIKMTSRKIVDPVTNKLVEVAGYTVELFNPTQGKYEPWGDEKGSPVFVKESVVMNHLSEYTQGPAAFEFYPALALSSSSAQTKMMADIVFEADYGAAIKSVSNFGGDGGGGPMLQSLQP
jgi:hypothetical protein